MPRRVCSTVLIPPNLWLARIAYILCTMVRMAHPTENRVVVLNYVKFNSGQVELVIPRSLAAGVVIDWLALIVLFVFI